jgi:hypothetical protein
MVKVAQRLWRALVLPPAERPSLTAHLITAGVGFSLLTLITVPSWLADLRVASSYVPQTCRVVDKRLGGDGTYRPELLLEYHHGGKPYREWSTWPGGVSTSERGESERVLAAYQPPVELPCFVDPREPKRAVVLRGKTPASPLFVAGCWLFIAFGARGFYWRRRLRGLSSEAIAALRGARRRELDVSPNTHLNVPLPEHRPGRELAFRLPAGLGADEMSLPATLLVTFITASVASMLGAITWIAKGGITAVTGTFFVLVAFLALRFIVDLVRKALVWLGLPPTRVELSHSPVVAGEPFRVLVGQRGSMRLNSFRVTLRCEERVHYREGTDLRTESRAVYEATLFDEVGVVVRFGEPLTLRCEHRLPRGAMHSFESEHNGVYWLLRCRGDVANYPDFCRDAPLVVLPATQRRGSPYREAQT